jgi:hypothetical protein
MAWLSVDRSRSPERTATFKKGKACGYCRLRLSEHYSTAGPILPHPLRIFGEGLRYTVVSDEVVTVGVGVRRPGSL